MSTARFALIGTALVVLIFFLSALSIAVVVLAVLAGLFAILRDHRTLYFTLQRPDSFSLAAYAFSVVMMIWTTLCSLPGIERLVHWGWHLPDPFPAGYWLHFSLGSLFLFWAMKPANPNALPMAFTGRVFWDQWSLFRQSPRVILESLKRSIAVISQDHWLKGLGGVALLVLSIPVGAIALTAGVLAVYWFAVLWAGLSALAVIPLWLVYKAVHRKGIRKVCPCCGRVHPISGPSPMGFLRVRCMCGESIGIWRSSGEATPHGGETNPLPWSLRPKQAGTIPLLILAVAATMLMVSRAFGLWDGLPRSVPWAREVRLLDAPAVTSVARS